MDAVPTVTKVRKPMSEEALAKLAVARELAIKKRRELSVQRQSQKEEKIAEKMLEATAKREEKLEKAAEREAARRMKKAVEPVAEPEPEPEPEPPKAPKKRNTVCVEYSSSDSDLDIDFADTRVLFVKKQREPRDPAPPPARPEPTRDPLHRSYLAMFGPR